MLIIFLSHIGVKAGADFLWKNFIIFTGKSNDFYRKIANFPVKTITFWCKNQQIFLKKT